MRATPRLFPATAAAVLLLALLMALPSPARALSCGGKLVNEGMTPYEVILACGRPDYQDTVRIDDFGFKIVKTDKWFYNCGYGRFIYILTFREGMLIDIETGSYGTGQNRCQ